MLLLSIDSATPVSSVAVVEDNTTRYELTINNGLKHSRTVLNMVDGALKQNALQLADLDAVAVTIGPGSFTGLRIGLAVAKGLAQSAGKALIGIPTLDALAYPVGWGTGLVCGLLNARKGEVYAAFYRGDQALPERITDYLALSPEKLVDLSEQMMTSHQRQHITFLGDGVAAFQPGLQAALGDAFQVAAEPLNWPRASSVGHLAMNRLRNHDVDDAYYLTPTYVRLSEAEARLAASRGEV